MRHLATTAILIGTAMASGCSETAETNQSTSFNPTFMSPTQMTDFCRGEAAGEFSTRPASVTVGVPQPGVDGGFIVTGNVDQGTMGNAPFECRFGDDGQYVSLTEL